MKLKTRFANFTLLMFFELNIFLFSLIVYIFGHIALFVAMWARRCRNEWGSSFWTAVAFNQWLLRLIEPQVVHVFSRRHPVLCIDLCWLCYSRSASRIDCIKMHYITFYQIAFALLVKSWHTQKQLIELLACFYIWTSLKDSYECDSQLKEKQPSKVDKRKRQ